MMGLLIAFRLFLLPLQHQEIELIKQDSVVIAATLFILVLSRRHARIIFSNLLLVPDSRLSRLLLLFVYESMLR